MSNIIDITSLDDLQLFADQLVNDIDVSKQTTIFLKGDLGTGKTTFVQKFLKSLGYNEHVPSPSYAIVNTYTIQGRVVLHADLYRLQEVDELDYLGWDMLTEKADIILIEWPEMLSEKPDMQLFFKEYQGSRSVSLQQKDHLKPEN